MHKRKTYSGAKAYQRSDTENRLKAYSDWHRTLDRKLYTTDVDFIEWRFVNGILTPVGIMEVTRVDKGKNVDDKYLNEIIQRFEQRDMQAKAIRKVAACLNTKAYIVLFREDCSEFWIYFITDSKGWYFCDPNRMENFLKALPL
jgi:hypothetical protein